MTFLHTLQSALPGFAESFLDQNDRGDNWAALPDELLLSIFCKLGDSFRDYVSAALTCKNWKKCVEDVQVGRELMKTLPDVEPINPGETWMKTYAYWRGKFPEKDEFTFYDYRIGRERMRLVREGKLRFESYVVLAPSHGLFFQSTMQTRQMTVVLNESYSVTKVNHVPKEKCLEFAEVCITKWGKENSEKILSATKTGSLYWNIIHNFDSFDLFLDQRERQLERISTKRIREEVDDFLG